MAADRACQHHEREDGVCRACGDCLHEIIVNGECWYCQSRDIDPAAVSPRKPDPADALVPADRLLRRTGKDPA